MMRRVDVDSPMARGAAAWTSMWEHYSQISVTGPQHRFSAAVRLVHDTGWSCRAAGSPAGADDTAPFSSGQSILHRIIRGKRRLAAWSVYTDTFVGDGRRRRYASYQRPCAAAGRSDTTPGATDGKPPVPTEEEFGLEAQDLLSETCDQQAS
jgi:hypothetical protein